jgi:hypothetical protein
MYYQKFKKTIIIFLAVSVVLVSFSQTAFGARKSKINTPLTNKGPTDGLVAWWTFDGQDTTWTSATAGTVTDKSGNGNTGTLSNMSRSSSPAPGISGQGFRFDGVDDYVSESAIDLSATNIVTLSFWMKKDFSTPEGVTFELTTNFNVNTDGFMVDANSASPCAGYIQVAHRGDTGYSVGCYTRPSSNAWHYYTVIFDKSLSTNEVNLYIDGQLQTAVSRPYNGNNTNNFGNKPFYIMSRAGSSYFDSGTIDDVRIYNRALSASEIQELYRLGSARLKANAPAAAPQGIYSGLVGYWTFDGQDTTWTSATAGTTLDKSGNGNTGTLTNMSRSSSPAPGISGQGFRFDGVDDKINAGTNSVLDLTNDLTVSAWVKFPAGTVGSNNSAIIIARSDGGWPLNTPDRGYALHCRIIGGNLWCMYNVSGATNHWYQDYNLGSANRSRWIHLVGTTQGNVHKFYVDGVEVLSATINTGDRTTGTSLLMGDDINGSDRMLGTIDDVRIYNRALSASEVQELYRLGARRFKVTQ